MSQRDQASKAKRSNINTAYRSLSVRNIKQLATSLSLIYPFSLPLFSENFSFKSQHPTMRFNAILLTSLAGLSMAGPGRELSGLSRRDDVEGSLGGVEDYLAKREPQLGNLLGGDCGKA